MCSRLVFEGLATCVESKQVVGHQQLDTRGEVCWNFRHDWGPEGISFRCSTRLDVSRPRGLLVFKGGPKGSSHLAVGELFKRGEGKGGKGGTE